MDSHQVGSEAAAATRLSEWAAFRASLPLIVVTVALFIGSVVVDRLDPTAGPGGFPLWGLLMTLGFIAAIGSTVSWFFAKGVADDATQGPTRTADTPDESGRPVPDVRRAPEAGTPEEWDESSLPVAPAPRAPPRAVATAPVAPDDVERALDEIAQIEEELEGRGPSSLGRSLAPTRS
jgi:hypothetical protein